MMLHSKYQASMPCGFRQEYFCIFILYKHMHVTPRAGPFLAPLFKLSRGLLGDALGLVVLDKKIFSCFPFIRLFITCFTKKSNKMLSYPGGYCS